MAAGLRMRSRREPAACSANEEGDCVHFIAKIILVLGGSLLAAGAPAAAQATEPGACSVTKAHRAVHAAHRAYVRAASRYREAQRVLSATRAAASLYGAGVARWVRLARGTGWPWGQIPQLMFVIARESGGDPNAKNPTSTASGLLQFLSGWFAGRWNPFNPRVNLSHGYRAWREVGWAPWAIN